MNKTRSSSPRNRVRIRTIKAGFAHVKICSGAIRKRPAFTVYWRIAEKPYRKVFLNADKAESFAREQAERLAAGEANAACPVTEAQRRLGPVEVPLHVVAGEWNDPDYLQLGYIGNARKWKEAMHAPFSATEEYSFMSLWCLIAAPLFYSGDIAKLDAFTLSILCNPEVIEIDQDPLGRCARLARNAGDTFVLAKDMEDGTMAVGLCNRGAVAAMVSVGWSELGLTGRQTVRDVWRQKDIGSFEEKYEASVPSHGVVLIRVHPDTQ